MPLLAVDQRRQRTVFGSNPMGMRMDEDWMVVWVESGLEEMQRYLARHAAFEEWYRSRRRPHDER
jgi:hypothetical protein